MQHEVEIRMDGDPADVVVSLRGSLAELADPRLHERLLREARPLARLLVDHAGVAAEAFGADDARRLADALPPLLRLLGPDARVALVAEGPAVYGCLRMTLSYAEIAAERGHSTPPGATVALFATQAEARDWLGPVKGHRPVPGLPCGR